MIQRIQSLWLLLAASLNPLILLTPMPERMAAGDIPDKLFGCDFTSVSDILIFERHPSSVPDDIGTYGKVEENRALIDTEALITGYSNEEMAQYLLDKGLKWCDGVALLEAVRYRVEE